MIESDEKLMKKLYRARRHWIYQSPFLGSLVMYLRPVLDDNTCPTGYTDGRVIGANREWLSKRTEEETRFFIAHEVMHCAYSHTLRLGKRIPPLWNIANDHVINLMLKEMYPDLTMPKDGCADEQYKGMSSEEVYNDLLKNAKVLVPQKFNGKGLPRNPNGSITILLPTPPEKGDGSKDGKEEGGDNGEGEGEQSAKGDSQDDSDAKEAEKWQRAISDAIAKQQEHDRSQGSQSGIDSLAELLLAKRPKVPWQSQLARYMQPTRGRPNWARPNRRYLAGGLTLPTSREHKLPCVVFVTDVSGSVGEADYELFSGELNGVLNRLRPEVTHILAVDTEIKNHLVLRDTDLPVKSLPGMKMSGGGTSFTAPFKWADNNRIQPSVLIYLTDMYGGFPSQEPPYPVIWVSVSGVNRAPFGQVIQLT